MGILHYLLEIYFVAVLGIAGIAKLDSPDAFRSALQFHYNVPGWSVKILSKTFPWIELLLAMLLLTTTQAYKFIVILLICMLFLLFFLLNALMQFKGRALDDCGCYGKSLRRKGVYTNSVVIFIQLFMIIALVFITLWTPTLSWMYYLASSMLFGSIYCWLLWRTWQRQHFFARSGSGQRGNNAVE